MKRALLLAVVVIVTSTSGCTPILGGAGAGIGYIDGSSGKSEGAMIGTMIGLVVDMFLMSASRR